MRYFINSILITLMIILVGCTSVDPDLKIQVSKHANPWTHLELYNNPDNFQFAIIADLYGGNRPGIFKDAVVKLNLLKPEFVMSVGDLIDGDTEDTAELDRQWEYFDAIVNKLEMPFYYVPGNHDIGNSVMAEQWRKRLGPSYYSFIYRDVLFLCLNTEDSQRHHISNRQIEYFRDVLQAQKNLRWTLVFMHQPVWKAESLENWKKLESLLADRAYTVFSGHKHTYQKSLRKGRQYYALATTGASGGDNELNQCQFDHILWVTMTDDGPVLANLLLDGILTDLPCSETETF